MYGRHGKKNVCAGGSWDEVVMLWATVTTHFTNDRCAFVVFTNSVIRMHGQWLHTGDGFPTVATRCISGCETRDGLTSSTQHRQFSRLHCIQRLNDSQKCRLFIREVNNRAEAAFPAGWSTTCLDVISPQTIEYPRMLRFCMWFVSIRHSLLEFWRCGSRWIGRRGPQSF